MWIIITIPFLILLLPNHNLALDLLDFIKSKFFMEEPKNAENEAGTVERNKLYDVFPS